MAKNSKPGSRLSRRGFIQTGLSVGTALLLPNLPGVRAIANGAQAKGSVTDTSVPVLSTDTYHSLFVNGTEIQVLFTQDETGTARRTNPGKRESG